MTSFSIVIPVRNALGYAPDAVLSALRGSALGTEIIISDNHSQDGSYQALGQLFGSERRIRIIQPDRPLSMTAHFNFALAQAGGAYVSIIGADDGVMPYFGEAMARLVEADPGADAFLSPRAYYFWPGVADEYGDRSILLHGRSGTHPVNPKREYRRALNGTINYADTLQMYAGSVISRSLIDRVRSADPDGLFYRGTQPDMYSTFTLLSHATRIVGINFPIHWTGSSPASNGYQHASRQGDDSRKAEFWDLAEGLDDTTTSEFDHGRESAVPLLVLDAAVRARRIHPFNGHRHLSRSELQQGLVGALARARPDQAHQVLETAERFSPPLKLSPLSARIRAAAVLRTRAQLALARRVAATRGGIYINQKVTDSGYCKTLGEANDLVASLGFTAI